MDLFNMLQVILDYANQGNVPAICIMIGLMLSIIGFVVGLGWTFIDWLCEVEQRQARRRARRRFMR